MFFHPPEKVVCYSSVKNCVFIICDDVNKNATAIFKQEWNIVSPDFDWDFPPISH